MRIGSDVFFDADSESPHMMCGKNATLRSYGLKTVFLRSRDQCASNWCTNFNCSLGLGFGDGLGLWLRSGHLLLSGDGLGLGFRVMVLDRGAEK